ncbi:hypothetical protein A3H10_03525 [Candidatus Uhrbacteria bacterium RIFCSPLOWO2_12_FULL_46_10]|uniref:Glycosyltransferase 2-like domain-containing protein n=1 Tax=Candidatus Uhrbacteria bacterium RIFCSPLOWO2_01_FULL_47_25 TaxID=1802402 RepID=A0A1F7URG5_9BACT|nr:MAG: Glycosyl transferase family 2 [Parcubacteria group bacterium GW2011_GWA2_46_9]OGL80298.1 MAG: hypothetical protein A2936_02935 [Candidatus Uhrbacteria bacterium RIFCSPLOWO2_01_FULL_47_25]OGL91318.1 MAG: hypothetical protein A3H10_03525 [Candidatus Uhrbacteria bacterium RIFCSPLOWO2_12_FULL_46_10]
MQSELVSIIIPTRNRSTLLPYAIRSVLGQTYKNIQVIVHDNNSSDETPEVVKPYLIDHRMEYHRANRDLAMAENWNAAFQYVKGNYFVRLDDDNVFSSNFIESALREVTRLDLDIMTFCPLIVHLNKKLFYLFHPEDKTYLLDQFQLFYFEYFTLTDSNYTLYRRSAIQKMLSDDLIYRGALADRFMNYSAAHYMNQLGLKVGINSLVKGVTRFDYRPSFKSDYQLTYTDYAKFSPESIKREMNCHNNFYAHRIATVMEFFDVYQNEKLQNFLENAITPAALRGATAAMGHIYRVKSVYTLKELFFYMRYLIFITWHLLMHPFSRMEGKCIWVSLAVLWRKAFWCFGRSFVNLVTCAERQATNVVEPLFGEQVIKEVLGGRKINSYKAASIHGSLMQLLKKISVAYD